MKVLRRDIWKGRIVRLVRHADYDDLNRWWLCHRCIIEQEHPFDGEQSHPVCLASEGDPMHCGGGVWEYDDEQPTERKERCNDNET